jgi:protein transport protein SEC23
MDFLYDIEDNDGVRFSWNIWPSSRIEYKKIVVPIACMYTPLKGTPMSVFYSPLPCSKCSAIVNPYCQVDLNSQNNKIWTCKFCSQRNTFPPQYQGISEANLPAELLQEGTTIEYKPPQNLGVTKPIFLFVVDTSCKHESEIAALKRALLRSLDVIPPDALVGFITYGATVQVYELPFKFMTKTVCFDGAREYTPQDVQQMLQVGIPTANGGATPCPQNKYVVPLSEVEERFVNVIEELQQDPHPYNKKEERLSTATGSALSIALSLLQWTFPNMGARVVLIEGGPPNIGPGKVVSTSLKEEIRSHHHLKKENTPHLKAALSFYNGLAERAVQQGHAVDIFSASLDQTGLMEMNSLFHFTGGIVVSTESFTDKMFSEALFKYFEKDENGNLKMGFNATIEVILSPEIKVMGAIGHMASLSKMNSHVSEVTSYGIGETSAWRMSTLDDTSTFAFYFDVVNPHNNIIPETNHGMVQFKTSYQSPQGGRVQRITTVAHTWSSPAKGLQSLLPGFDQEAAITLIARLVAFKASREEIQPRGWLDKHLIQLCNTFGRFQKDRVETFQLPSEMQMYPEFIFHLRRGILVSTSGCSPDETTFFRHYLLSKPTSSCLTMIQPSLDSYSFESEEPQPVLLSTRSIIADQMLLLDTFFHLIIFSGDTISKWKKAGYHELEEYENLRQLLQAPHVDADHIMKTRFPFPKFVECDSGGSQARYLYAVLDPAETHISQTQVGFSQPGRQATTGTGDIVYTEDVPLSVFLDHLYIKAVSYEG